jgi:hypothetical protein
MFRILCFTTGQHIKIPASLSQDIGIKMPSTIREAIGTPLTKLQYKRWSEPRAWEYAEFDTEEAAKWFISHRLVFNPRRKDQSKLEFMRELFEFNDIPGWETIKIEFEADPV